MDFLQKQLFAQQQNARAGRTELLSDNQMHVVLVGTGCPIFDPNRSGPCTAVIVDNEFYLVDCGPGSWNACLAAQLPVKQLSGVLLTHFHSDHIGELGEVFTQNWITGGPQETDRGPLPVYGPEGVQQVVDGFNAAYAQDFVYREDHHSEEYMPVKHAGAHAVVVTVPEAEGDALWDQEAIVLDKVTHQPIT